MADILVAQYFQQVPPPQLSLPDGPTLLQPAVQTSLYERMFADTDTNTNADPDPDTGTETGNCLPPASYQTRVLKMIITRLEESISDPEDVCPCSILRIYIYIYIRTSYLYNS